MSTLSSAILIERFWLKISGVLCSAGLGFIVHSYLPNFQQILEVSEKEKQQYSVYSKQKIERNRVLLKSCSWQYLCLWLSAAGNKRCTVNGPEAVCWCWEVNVASSCQLLKCFWQHLLSFLQSILYLELFTVFHWNANWLKIVYSMTALVLSVIWLLVLQIHVSVTTHIQLC